jgi:hypothetical protein
LRCDGEQQRPVLFRKFAQLANQQSAYRTVFMTKWCGDCPASLVLEDDHFTGTDRTFTEGYTGTPNRVLAYVQGAALGIAESCGGDQLIVGITLKYDGLGEREHSVQQP